MPAMTLAPLIAALAIQTPVEVPFRFGDDAIIVDAVVNSRKVSLMFDTGFSGSVILNASIDIGPKTGVMNLRDFVGTFQASTAKIKTLKLGTKTIDSSEMEAVLTGDRDYSFSYNTHCDGIMGFEVLQGNVVEINFEKQKFVFHPNSNDISKRVPDNKKTFLTKLLPTGHNSLELNAVAPNGKKMILALDTGNAFYATTHKDVLERVGLWPVNQEAKFMKSSMVASGEVASWYKKMKNIEIFGVPVQESIWSIIDLPSSAAENDGTVGFGFLKNFNVTFDYERRRVWLENFTGKVGNEPDGDLGISAFVNPDDKRLTIFRVAPESPAAKAGIKRGDHILSIDGEENLNVGYRKLIKLFEGPKGTKAKLVVSRQGNLMRFEVERDYLINE
jgi:predicted aspartyl protease